MILFLRKEILSLALIALSVAVPCELFKAILERIGRLWLPPQAASV
jgi:hypothetical protein